ncbi:GTP-binding nuclear protein Ran-like [Drosophila sulfurigaster albostrigata]|uniref:GTP-binding nuclear protein Ran-like n=1 Tax=Drosophila sulfurigaster albostrigata TaxID=89887 RepID=UPI002D218689|nr:GTP-binding nuclear protein Ran-like [Drosophila sulfurigaster albostrigata]
MELKASLSSQDTHKCLLLGDSGVGKTTFLRRHATGHFKDTHKLTKGVQVHTLLLQTDYQDLALELWEVAGDERHGGLNDGYFFFAKCAIIMFDLSVESTALSVARWLRSFERICGKQLPVIVCGNKADLKRMPRQLCYRQQPNFDYCELSARAAWNLEAPLELLSRQLLQRRSLKLISQPILKPKVGCTFNEDEMQQQMKLVHEIALPELIEVADESEEYYMEDTIILN